MAAVPVTSPPAPPDRAGYAPPADSRYGDPAAGPLFATPHAMERFRGATGTHSLAGGYLLWVLAPISVLIGAGAHRFYYGKPLTGILWTFTFGLLGVGWIVDFFLMPRMEEEADRKYTPGPYDYNVAWILNAIPFLGVFGIHRFYLGKWPTGLLWLVTAGLFGFGWVWDLCTLNEQVDSRNRRAAPIAADESRRESEGFFGIGW